MYKVFYSSMHEMTPLLQKLFHISFLLGIPLFCMLLTLDMKQGSGQYQLLVFGLVVFFQSMASKFNLLALGRIHKPFVHK